MAYLSSSLVKASNGIDRCSTFKFGENGGLDVGVAPKDV